VQRQLITVRGIVSKKETRLKVSDQDLDKNLMVFLQENGFPIASSCRGEGVCQKCILSNEILSCSINVKDYLIKFGNLIEVDYL
jgi:Na+-transporting NADH:ubiquinone oxidoreductase subunit NqrF